jgi:hypothetical protein
MTEDRKLVPFIQPDDFVGFVAAEHGISRDAAQAVLGQWLRHYQPGECARGRAREQAEAEQAERARATSAA